jgi:CelD/BcsL family acetyltransferase involved in cellulose biosynthesis
LGSLGANEAAALTTAEGLDAFAAVAPEWNALAEAARSPFLTVDWLTAWWDAFGAGTLRVLLLRDDERRLRAGAALAARGRRLTAPANYHSGGWDVVAADAEARSRLWAALARTRARELVLGALPDGPSTGACDSALRAAGFRLVREPGQRSPFLPLPATFDQLVQGRSGNLRSQVGRRRRALERVGELRLRTVCDTGEDLEAVFRVEAAGWKAAAGTAILADGRAERLYRAFARAAAARGWLRLHLLELDRTPIAADFAVAFAGGEFLLKTGFDERHRDRSPGLVLRAEVLRAAIESGLRYYDFLGQDDPYKLRWTAEIRPRVTLRAYRGPLATPAYAYRRTLRPLLKALRGDPRRGGVAAAPLPADPERRHAGAAR